MPSEPSRLQARFPFFPIVIGDVSDAPNQVDMSMVDLCINFGVIGAP